MAAPVDLDLARFRQYPIFQDLTLEELQQFLANTLLQRYEERDGRIVGQGDQANGLGIILSGKVKISRTDASNREHLLTVLKEGDFFGEMALLDPAVRSANVQALEPTSVLWMNADRFRGFLAGHSPLIAKILCRMVADLSKRLRLLDERYVFIKGYFETRSA